MSEEEIIKYIKDEIENETDTYHWFDDTPDNKTRKQIEESINAHQGLLDLYNKEKEKNASLKKEIKNIKEYVNSPEFLDWHLGFTKLNELEYRKDNINKLLEEEK